MNKNELRKIYLKRRRILGKKRVVDADLQIVKNVINYINNNSDINTLFLYSSANSEPNLFSGNPNLWRNLVTALPKVCEGKKLKFFRYRVGDLTVTNRFGVAEPITQTEILPDKNTLILVPAVVINRAGYRIGYGGGYYDRYLAAHPAAIKMGVVFEDFFISDVIDTQPHDVPMDYVVTENGVFAFGTRI